VVRVVLAEAIVLATVGGAAGLGLAFALTKAARNMRFDFGLPVSLDVRLDGSVLLFSVAISAAAGLVFGLLPALRVSPRSVGIALRDDAATAIGARRRFGLTGLLVAGQVAVSVLLLAVASVFLESLSRAQRADPGFTFESTAYVQASMRSLEATGEDMSLLHGRLVERLEALPEVGRVAIAAQLPAALRGTTTLLLGAAIDGMDRPTEIPWNAVSSSYFDVMGVPLLHGRLFDERDLSGPTVAVVSAAMARTYWGRTDVVGESYRSENRPDAPVPIVGVVADAAVRALGERPAPSLYWVQDGLTTSNLLFEAVGDPARAIASVRSEIASFDPRILLLGSASMRDHLGGTLARQRLAGALLGAMGALALLLAVLGVYGVVSFAVSRRRKEVGIRLALGAGRDSVVRLFVADVAGVVLAGSVAGLALSIPMAEVVARVFTGAVGSPVTTLAVASLLIATSLMATAVPALRAAGTDPTEALRQE
jgi:predicted permease